MLLAEQHCCFVRKALLPFGCLALACTSWLHLRKRQEAGDWLWHLVLPCN